MEINDIDSKNSGEAGNRSQPADLVETAVEATDLVAGHTPLPWAIYDYEGRISKYPRNIIVCSSGESIAEIEGGWPQCALAENEANAALIVNAVNSHSALVAHRAELRAAAQHVINMLNDDVDNSLDAVILLRVALASTQDTKHHNEGGV